MAGNGRRLHGRGSGAFRGAAALAGAAAAISLLAGCGGSSAPATVNPTHVEEAIAGSVKAQRHQNASVTCPTGVPLRDHQRFYCVAQVGTTITPFAVTTTSAKGAVRYVGVAADSVPQLNMSAIEAAITQSVKAKRQLTATVACPTAIPRQRGLSFVCTAAVRGRGTSNFVVRQLNDSGHVSYSTR